MRGLSWPLQKILVINNSSITRPLKLPYFHNVKHPRSPKTVNMWSYNTSGLMNTRQRVSTMRKG